MSFESSSIYVFIDEAHCKLVYCARRPLTPKDRGSAPALQMISILSSILLLGLSLSFIVCPTPLALALWVLSTALTGAALVGRSLYSWFGFIIFLIYIGGILVIFAYFLALQPNQQIKIKLPALALITALIILPWTITPAPLHSSWHQFWLSSLIATYNIPIMVILGLVLFLALLVVVKASSFFRGPLRPFN